MSDDLAAFNGNSCSLLVTRSSLLLLAEIFFFDLRIVFQFFWRAFQRNVSAFQNIRAVGNVQRLMHSLFDQQNGQAALLEFANDLEDALDDERRESERRLVKQQ